MKKLLFIIMLLLLTSCNNVVEDGSDTNSIDDNKYFEVKDLIYDGPMLDDEYLNINPIDPRGGLIDVSLLKCVDGDTAKFDYPPEVESTIKDNTSVRFLNLDTEEVYNNPEEFGKPASVFTCNQLEGAYQIAIQTDPGDNLFDKYDRLLGWIWVKPSKDDSYQLLNYMILRQGLAKVAYLYGAGETIYYNDISYTDWMYQAENYAERDKLGLHGYSLDPYWNYETNVPNY